jgi:nucleotide-binding universal stress UspA family protein
MVESGERIMAGITVEPSGQQRRGVRSQESRTECPCPLSRCDRILVAVDASTQGQKAVEHAISMAKVCHSTLLFLSVIAVHPEAIEFAAGLEHDLSEEGARILDEAKSKARLELLPCETILRVGPEPHKLIVQEAVDRQVDLIVMGTHGRTGLNKLLMGSVAEKVVRLAPPCAVLVTPN